MIQFREVKESDMKQLEVFLAKHDVRISDFYPYLHQSMLLEINSDIFGFAAFKMLNDSAFEFITLIIDLDHRSLGYGDGLLKASLNMADLRGIKSVYSKLDHNSFLKHLGFEEVYESDLPEYSLKVALPDYFNTVCKSKRNR